MSAAPPSARAASFDLAGLALSALVLAGCATVDERTRVAYAELRVPASECRAPGPATVSPEAMRSDWRAVEHVLRRGYAGFERAGSEETWARVFREGAAAIGDEPMSALAFRDFVLSRLAFTDDNHLGAWVRGEDGRRRFRTTSGHRQAYVSDAVFRRRDDGEFVDPEGRVLLACGDDAPADALAPTFAAGELGWRLLFLADDPVGARNCTVRGEGGAEEEARYELRRPELADRRGPVFHRRQGELPWLRLRSLGMANSGVLETFAHSAAEVRDEPVLVLDVRDNGGGADRFLLRFFGDLTSEDLPYFETWVLTSEVELQGALTFWGCMAELSSDDGQGQAWMASRIAEARRSLDRAMRERGTFRDLRHGRYVEPGRAPRPFTGRLILLVNRGCGSACESAVLLARHLPGAIVVGENTEGTMKVGELRYYRLPQSGVWLSVGRRAHIDPREGGFPEGVGYQPDLWLAGDDVDANVRALARCVTDPACSARLPAPAQPSRSAEGSPSARR